jgi:[methyl-Co(III) methanol-specific corrinoid protein]:coenzyme M methyltransferase
VTQKERLIKVLRKEPVDRTPFICPGGMMTMIVTGVMETSGVSWPEAHADPGKMAALTLAAHRFAGVENLGVPFCMTVEAEAMGAAVDLGTAESEPKVIAYAVDAMEDVDRLAELVVTDGRAKVCTEAIRVLKEKAPELPIIANLTGPVSLATSLIDPLIYYRAMRKNKASAHRLTDMVTGNLIRFGRAMLLAGADVLCIADPSATGEIVGRNGFEEFVAPYINRIIERLTGEFHVPSIVHICGNVKTLGNALGGLAADAISVDSMVNIALLKQMIGEKVSMGNVSTHLLADGSADTVLSAARGCLRKGVDILAPACGISPKTPLENVKALQRAATATGEAAGSD